MPPVSMPLLVLSPRPRGRIPHDDRLRRGAVKVIVRFLADEPAGIGGGGGEDEQEGE